MSSEIKANKISPATGTAFTFGDSGDTFTIPSGVTLTNNGSSSGFDSGLSDVKYIFTSGTWTKPSGVTKVRVYVTGGGGSGSTNTSAHNSGGYGGGTAIKFIDVTSISSATVTIGAGGPANTVNNGTGQTGGDSQWSDGTNTLIGQGGNGAFQTSTAKGNASGGDLNINGDASTSYVGGSSFWSNRSHSSHTNSMRLFTTSSNTPTVASLGQGGMGYYGSGVTGYAGGDGIIVVEEYK